MPPKIKFVTIPIRIATVFYLLGGIAGVIMIILAAVGAINYSEAGNIAVIGIMMAGTGLVMPIINEVIAHYLKKGAFVAWIFGILLTIQFIFSLFFVLGVIMAIGLFNSDVIEYCKNQKS